MRGAAAHRRRQVAAAVDEPGHLVVLAAAERAPGERARLRSSTRKRALRPSGSRGRGPVRAQDARAHPPPCPAPAAFASRVLGRSRRWTYPRPRTDRSEGSRRLSRPRAAGRKAALRQQRISAPFQLRCQDGRSRGQRCDESRRPRGAARARAPGPRRRARVRGAQLGAGDVDSSARLQQLLYPLVRQPQQLPGVTQADSKLGEPSGGFTHH